MVVLKRVQEMVLGAGSLGFAFRISSSALGPEP